MSIFLITSAQANDIYFIHFLGNAVFIGVTMH